MDAASPQSSTCLLKPAISTIRSTDGRFAATVMNAWTRDSCFKESKRRAFEEYQRELQYFLRNKSFVTTEDCL